VRSLRVRAAAAAEIVRPWRLLGRFRAPLNLTVRRRGRVFLQSWFLRYGMSHTRIVVVLVALAAGLVSCVVAVAPVPGSENIRITRNASEASSCKAVGNIRVNASGSNARTEFRNTVVGLGGNVGVVTNGAAWAPVEGIAYLCP
jgi:hypothetical protein